MPASIGAPPSETADFSYIGVGNEPPPSTIAVTLPSERPAAAASTCADSRASATAAFERLAVELLLVGDAERRAVDLVRARLDGRVDQAADAIEPDRRGDDVRRCEAVGRPVRPERLREGDGLRGDVLATGRLDRRDHETHLA